MHAHDRDARSWASQTTSEMRTHKSRAGDACSRSWHWIVSAPELLKQWRPEVTCQSRARGACSRSWHEIVSAPDWNEDTAICGHGLKALAHDRDMRSWAAQSCHFWQSMLTRARVPIMISFIAVVIPMSRSWHRIMTSQFELFSSILLMLRLAFKDWLIWTYKTWKSLNENIRFIKLFIKDQNMRIA